MYPSSVSSPTFPMDSQNDSSIKGSEKIKKLPKTKKKVTAP
jgi:hypothetical protein